MTDTNQKHEPTHNSDTVADEVGGVVKEVPAAREPKQEQSMWKWTIVAVAAIALVVGLSVGLTVRDDDSSDDGPDVTTLWLAVGRPVTEDLSVREAPADVYFEQFDLSSNGKTLIVAGLSADFTPQMEWHEWENDTWVHQSTLNLGDAHTTSHPVVYLAGDAPLVIVADEKAFEAIPFNADGSLSLPTIPGVDLATGEFWGLFRVYELTPGDVEDEVPRFTLRLEEPTRDMWGASVAVDDAGVRMVVGSPMEDADGVTNAGMLQAYDLDMTTELTPIGSPLFGQDTFDALGAADIALSSDGATLVAGVPLERFQRDSRGQVRVWRWVEGDWEEEVIVPANEVPPTLMGKAGQGLGRKVHLNQDGTVLAATTLLTNEVLVYSFTDGAWIQMGEPLSGSDVHLSPDGTSIAVVDEDAVQVYDWVNDMWIPVGDSIPGTSARLTDDYRVVIQYQGAVRTWTRVGFV
mmetsp:Transcript_3580/g.7145  ORF Transcript_3580/g.7145 Transcript_3580/m.7145 type:complete len:463 (+) Transcript_3580:82-1470(+)